MTEKQENILKAALQLFAQEGYKATSTSKVAKLAGVSEGLIFRHFKNKEGLLEAIIQKGEEEAKILWADIVLETDPKETLRKTIKIADKLKDSAEAIEFWKLQFKIKWELEIYGEHKVVALKDALKRAFASLKYEQPENEADLLIAALDGMAMHFFLREKFDRESAMKCLMAKYNL